MRASRVWIPLLILLIAGCQQADSWEVTYVATGTAARIDVAVILPPGVPSADDTLFVRGESMHLSGDTTFISNVAPAWKYTFRGEAPQPLFIRVVNRTERGHVTGIVYLDDQYHSSVASAEPNGSTQWSGTLR
jgi:hypothetical protein